VPSARVSPDRADAGTPPDAGLQHDGERDVPTNAGIARRFDDDAAAQDVATALDRAAFDPTWVDDDAEFDRARSALATLERQRT
ncbi:MAG: hypothetical protein WBP59_02380, partial [Ilumatobacteraceae bacterium]